MKFDYVKILPMADEFLGEDRDHPDERWYAERYIGPRMAFWAMVFVQCRQWEPIGITDKFYRVTYFTYLHESDGDIVSQFRNYETYNKLFYNWGWGGDRCYYAGDRCNFKELQIIAVSWIRANMAARRIQRFWRWRKQTAAALAIQKAWREAISNPSYTLCKKRLLREAGELTI
jgi:hypothetical protein